MADTLLMIKIISIPFPFPVPFSTFPVHCVALLILDLHPPSTVD